MNVTFTKNTKDPRPGRKGVFLKGSTYHISGELLDELKKKKVIKEFEELKIVRNGNNSRNESKD